MEFVETGIPFGIGGIALFFGLKWFRRHSREWRRYVRLPITFLLCVIIILLFVTSGVVYWYTHRPVPSDLQKELYEGVVYIRDVRSEPRPVIIHVIEIDLNQANIRFAVTAGNLDADRAFSAQTTSDFLQDYGVQIAINGDFFEPWRSDRPWDYYPEEGERIDVSGLSSSEGVIYGRGHRRYRAFYMSENQVPSFERPPDGEIYNAISGNLRFLENGEYALGNYRDSPDPRTVVALNESGDLLLLVVVDGSQPNYSEGLTLKELADVLIEHGGYTALNFDGGGSSTLVIEDERGNPEILNSPIDSRIPGRERPVPNHLGIYVDP